ncbi:hypothetical protein GHT07_12305 [Caenimonas koreensis DSM 17982]|uniref:Uncharacterized protein n=1 Tax=Caenimonas koreensis DSM 17982 TaxID=1121255 RepID=A0A844AUL7_9BURK|nr:hypothetical protein [Caenimonas koreensis]MRD48065.1 hypothetical protein [Caenimonas koreensis DSM 17982]
MSTGKLSCIGQEQLSKNGYYESEAHCQQEEHASELRTTNATESRTVSSHATLREEKTANAQLEHDAKN